MSTKEKKENTLVPVDTFVAKCEKWYLANEKRINAVSIGILVVVLFLIFLFVFWMPKRQQKAEVAIFKAEQYFAKDSLQTALNGDGVYDGLLDVASKYGCTKTGNRAKYEIAVCYMKEGKFEDAVKYFKKFKGKDLLLSVQALGNIADAYVELGNWNKALTYYKKAVKKNPNDLLTPVYMYRAGLVCEKLEKWSDAAKLYDELKHAYPASMEAADIDKRIEYVNALQGK